MSGTPAEIVTIEPCGMMHGAVIARLHTEFMADSWDEAAFNTLLATAGTFGFLALADGVPAGFVLCRAAAQECEILTIGVAPPVRRKGIGGRLLDAAVDGARRQGISEIFLEVGAANRGARQLYDSRRFVAVGQRPAYYRHAGSPPEDALIMRLDLGAAAD
jgi:[ribosomal protein S18]-alanine N-acetyltransferase